MSGNNENGGESARVCSRCLDCILSVARCIRNAPFRLCFEVLKSQVCYHFIRSLTLFISIAFITYASLEFRDENFKTPVIIYCTVLIICSFVTFLKPKGFMSKEFRKLAGEERLQKKREKQSNRLQEAPQRPRRRAVQPFPRTVAVEPYKPVVVDQPYEPVAGCSTAEVAAPMELENVCDAPFDFHHAEEPSESSNPVDPDSAASDEPIQQPAASDLNRNLPQSSTEPSTQSTFSTPLDISNEDPTKTEAQE